MTVPAGRRAVLATTIASAVAVGSAVSKAAASVGGRPLPVSHDPALHAARRLSYGATPKLVDHIRSVGLAAWLDEQLTTSPDLQATVAAPLVSLPLPTAALAYEGRDTLADLKAGTLYRAVWGDHQLFEQLVELWSNHLSIRGDSVGPMKVTDDRVVIRANALGTFSDMLVASCQSPAMLRYLGNEYSYGSAPNENYARELLELHTVGPQAGYRAHDIRNAARVLSGLSVNPGTLDFQYQADWHYVGPVRVMGWSHPNNDKTKGVEVATSMVRYLATHPATARMVATKLIRRFVSDKPSPSLVSSTASAYLQSKTAIAPTLRHVLLSAEFARSAGQKSQRPFDWAAASIRALGLQQDVNASDPSAVLGMMRRLGQAPFEWGQPDGYPDVTSRWASTQTTLERWNTAQHLVNGAIQGIRPPDTAALIGSPAPATGGALVDHLVHRLLGIAPRSAMRAALLEASGLKAGTSLAPAAAQSLTPRIAALILSSPEAMVR
ncbi:MAG: hypothetical protein JWN31_60 [Frankiales bacterium]|nr:hypothetical protein [Frankiales bacterium]